MNKRKLKHIIEFYGYRHQIGKLIEETSELLIELSKEKETRSLIVEEMADVLVVMKQFQIFYNIKDKEINKIAKYKIKRTIRRLNGK